MSGTVLLCKVDDACVFWLDGVTVDEEQVRALRSGHESNGGECERASAPCVQDERVTCGGEAVCGAMSQWLRSCFYPVLAYVPAKILISLSERQP